MRPRRRVVVSFEAQKIARLEADERERIENEQKARQAEAENQLKKRCQLAKTISESCARFMSPGNVALGRDALTRVHESSWMAIDHDDDLEADIEARVVNIHRIVRNGTVETGSTYTATKVDLRLMDPLRNIVSAEDIGAVWFGEDEIRVNEDSGERVIAASPDTDWTEIDSLLDKLASAFI